MEIICIYPKIKKIQDEKPILPLRLKCPYKPRYLDPQKHNLFPSPPLTLSLSIEKYIHTYIKYINLYLQELANLKEPLFELEEACTNRRVVLALYEALNTRDVNTVHKLLAEDLEWWYHGPPSHQFMMQLLTGITKTPFHFHPLSITALGSNIVLTEGCDLDRSISWIHAWTVTDGIITQVREYFNTSLTVTKLNSTGVSKPSDLRSDKITALHCPSVWESTLSNKSVPGLVLAI